MRFIAGRTDDLQRRSRLLHEAPVQLLHKLQLGHHSLLLSLRSLLLLIASFGREALVTTLSIALEHRCRQDPAFHASTGLHSQ
jgi:hypothetical protein